jgi:HSP20 family protein
MTDLINTQTKLETPTEPLKLATMVDVYQNDTGFLIRADLPGVAKENVAIELEDNELRLEATRPGRALGTTTTPEKLYRRTFRIPQDIDAAGIDASLEIGVLNVFVPKAKPPAPRKIAIR